MNSSVHPKEVEEIIHVKPTEENLQIQIYSGLIISSEKGKISV